MPGPSAPTFWVPTPSSTTQVQPTGLASGTGFTDTIVLNQSLQGQGSDPAVSAAGTAKLIYNTATASLRVSLNGGAYSNIPSSGSITLQNAYSNGPTIATTTLLGPVIVGNANNDNNDTLQVNKTGIGSGSALSVTSSGATTGPAVLVNQAGTGAGIAIVQSGVGNALTISGGVADVGITRAAAGVLRITDAGTGAGKLFAGPASITPQYAVTGANTGNVVTRVAAWADTAGTASAAQFYAVRDGAAGVSLTALSASYTTSGISVADSGVLATDSVLSGGLTLATQGAQSVSIATNATFRWVFNSSGHMIASTANTYDLGSAAAAARSVYAATSLQIVSTGAAGYLESADGSSAAVSGAATGRIRYNNSAGAWQVSVQGGAYADIATGSGSTLQAAYDGGASIATSLANGAVTISNTNAANTNVLSITKNPAGIQSGDGVSVSMGANTTGSGLNVAMTTGSTGKALLATGIASASQTGVQLQHASTSTTITTDYATLLIFQTNNTNNNYSKITFANASGNTAAELACVYANHVTAAASYLFRTSFGGNANETVRINRVTGTGTVNGEPFLSFGGTTSSFPAIRQVGTELQARLADDSASASYTSATFKGFSNTGAGENVTFSSGSGTSASGTVTISSGTVTGGATGSITIAPGTSVGTDQNAGVLTLRSGVPTGAGYSSVSIQSCYSLVSSNLTQSYIDRMLITSQTKALSTTTATPTTFCTASLATATTGCSLFVDFVIEVSDGTNCSAISGTAIYTASNTGGTVTAGATTATDTVNVKTSDTTTFTSLTTTWDATVSGTTVNLRVTPTWAAGTPTSVKLTYQVRANGPTNLTPQ